MTQPTVLHMFAGLGGCTRGMQRAGWRSVGSIDRDAKALAQLRRWTGTPVFAADIGAMQPAELRALVPEAPDMMIMSPPCKSFSGCMPAARAAEDRYVDMSQLAVRATFLALEAWPRPPGLILIENVPRIQTRGAPLLEQIVGLLHRYEFAVDTRTHCCGRLFGGAQQRLRFLLLARHMPRVRAFVRRPPEKPLRGVGEVIMRFPSPVAEHADPMHRMPLLSPMNWLRLAAIRPGRDWRDLPAEIVIAGRAEATDPRPPWDRERHAGRPDSWGVGSLDAPSLTIRGRQEVQTSRRSIVDTRLGERAARQNGGFGVEDDEAPAHAVLAEGSVQNTRASVVDTRLGCAPRRTAYGVQDPEASAGAVLGHHAHDNAVGSVADARLGHSPRRGTLGVLDPAEPAPTIRGHHGPRQAPAAVLDSRGWPVPTHELVRDVDGTLTLYQLDDGAPLDITSKRPCLLVIASVDRQTGRRGWHRPMTPRELFALQDGDDDFVVEGPRSSSKDQAGIIEWIGNMIPCGAAEAIGTEAKLALESSEEAGFLRGPDVWVQPDEHGASDAPIPGEQG